MPPDRHPTDELADLRDRIAALKNRERIVLRALTRDPGPSGSPGGPPADLDDDFDVIESP